MRWDNDAANDEQKGVAEGRDDSGERKPRKKGVIRRSVGWWVRGWTDPLKRIFRPTMAQRVNRARAKAAWFDIRGLKAEKGRLKKQGITTPRDYGDMLAWWGVSDKDIPLAVRGLLIEAGLFIFVTVVSIFSLAENLWGASTPRFVPALSSMMVMVVCIAGAMNRLWRRDCLANQRFVRFTDWFRGVDPKELD